MLKPRHLFLLCALLASCQNTTPSKASRGPIVSNGPSEYGDRAGPRGFKTVIIDAGHGGHDSGATSNATGAKEKDLALIIAQKTAAILGNTHRVILLRDTDRFIDLDERVNLANRHPDAVLVSIHLNDSGSGVSGAETYWWRTDSYSLATRLQRNLSVVSGQMGSRGLVRRRLRLTRNPTIPCVLVECGYLSNSYEAVRLNTPAYQARIARSIATAIQETSEKGDVGMGQLPKPIIAPPSRPTDPADS